MLNESTRIPEVLLSIPAQYLPLIIDKISNIMQLVFPRLCLHMCFHYCARHDAYPELFGQLLIFVQISLPLLAKGQELMVFGHPVCEMVFRENGEVCAF